MGKIFERIRSLVKKIPKGKVTAYGAVAQALGIKDVRLIGWAIFGNTNPAIPCHRLVKKNGMLAENYSLGGVKEQRKKLEKEGIKFLNETQVDLEKHFWKP